MRRVTLSSSLCVLSLAVFAGCDDQDHEAVVPPAADGGLEIAVAPLTLSGVGRAVYTVSVANTNGPVWSRTLDSDQFGDGRGSLSYVGPCDASVPSHTVTVLLTALYDESNALIGPTTYRNPTPAVVAATCAANADTLVPINLTIFRDALQGFFDIAVNFDDIFCSAKLDCEGDLGQDLKLLHRPGGPRDTTLVLGFACTGGPEQSVDTHLYLDDLVITCSNATYSATVDPSGGPGNVTPLGNAGGLLFAAAVYRGDEAIASKAYWNVALGLNKLAAAGTCRLTTRGTASDGPLDDNTTAPFTAYPFIEWDLEILAAGARTCTKHQLNSPEVMTDYTPLAATGRAFDHGYRRGSTGVITPEGCTDCHLTSFAPAAIPTGTPTVVTLSGSFAAAGACTDCELVTVPDATPLTATFDSAAGTVTFTAPSGSADLEVQLLVGLDVVPLRTLEVDAAGRLVEVERDTVEIPRQAPVVTSVSGCISDEAPYARDCDVSGGMLSIVGQNFGATAAGVTVRVGGVDCTGVAVVTPHTRLSCVLGAGAGFDLDLAVTVGGRTGTLAGAVSYFGPMIMGPVQCTSGCTQDGGSLIGANASLTFDVFPQVFDQGALVVEVGRDEVWAACTVVSVTPVEFRTRVVCQLPASGVGRELGVRVRVGGLTSRVSDTDLRFGAPQIMTVAPFVGTLNGGEWVPLTVRNAGNTASALTVRYGPYTCGGVRIASVAGLDTLLECATVPGSGGPHSFVVSALNQTSAPGVATFTYPAVPVVTGVSGCPEAAGAGTAGCATAGGQTLFVSGSSFSPTSTLWLGASSAGPATFISPTALSFQLPAGVGGHDVSVRQGAIVSLPLIGAIRYAPPTIASVSGCTDLGATTYGCPAAGGTTLTIVGADFGPSGASVTVGGVSCASLGHDATTPHSKLRCVLPAGSGLNAEVRVVAGGQVSQPAWLSYQ